MPGAELSQWEPKDPLMLKLSEALRKGRDIGRKVAVPEGVPLIGGMNLGDMFIDKLPEATSRIAYDEPLTTGSGETLQMHPDVASSVVNLAGMVNPSGKGGSAGTRTLEGALKKNVERGATKIGSKLVEAAAPEGPDAAADIFANLSTANAKREAGLAAKRARQQASETPVATQTGAGGRAKIDPDFFRQMYASYSDPAQGQAAVLAAANKGQHLKPTPGGGWVGAPDTVQNRRDLGAMRASLDKQLNDAYAAISAADPTRVGTWYDRAKAGQATMHEPWQLDRGLEQTGTYSAGVAPDSELAFKLKHNVSRALGTDTRAYRGAGAKTLDEAVAKGEPADLAHKVGEYRGKNDPRQKEVSPFGVNDFRMAQSYGYLDTPGNLWTAGVSDTMHPFMDLETALMGYRANQRKLGGDANWSGAKIQELPWVLGKAGDIYSRGNKPGARFGGPEGAKEATRVANNTLADYLPKHTASVPVEPGWSVPGGNVEGLPHWDSPYGAPGPEVGAGPRDAMYRASGMLQLPSIESGGQTLARPLTAFQTARALGDIDPETGAQVAAHEVVRPGTMSPDQRSAYGAVEGLRALIDEKPTGRVELPVDNRSGLNDLLLQREGPVTPEELARVRQLTGGTGMTANPVSQGVQLTATEPGFGQQRAALKLSQQLREAVPGINPSKTTSEGLTVPGVSPPELAGKGTATQAALQRFADAPPALSSNVSESDELRRLIGQRPPTDRPDVQKSREFFQQADWDKVVRLMRKGVPAAAALGGLGYSLEGMAAERDR